MNRILIVEDDIVLCEIMEFMILSMSETEVVVVNSFQGIKDLKEPLSKFDLIFLDINLGVNQLSGIDIFHWLQTQKYLGHVTFFTGHAKAHPGLQDALKLPRTQLLEKPATLSDIQAIIRKVPAK